MALLHLWKTLTNNGQEVLYSAVLLLCERQADDANYHDRGIPSRGKVFIFSYFYRVTRAILEKSNKETSRATRIPEKSSKYSWCNVLMAPLSQDCQMM